MSGSSDGPKFWSTFWDSEAGAILLAWLSIATVVVTACALVAAFVNDATLGFLIAGSYLVPTVIALAVAYPRYAEVRIQRLGDERYMTRDHMETEIDNRRRQYRDTHDRLSVLERRVENVEPSAFAEV